MTDYGSIIANLRKEHNMTQAELGEALNVTFQAVSKWERNLSQPDLDTIKAMANLFGVSLDIFNDEAVMEEESEDDEQESEEIEEKYTCSHCGKICNKSEMANATAGAICKKCHAKAEEEKAIAKKKEEEAKQAQIREFARQRKKKFWIALIVGLSVFLLFFIIFSAGYNEETSEGTLADTLFGALIIAFFAGSFVAQLCYNSFVRSVILWGFSRFIQMPGIIFSLDLDSIIFMLIYKIVAPIIGILIGLAIGLIATAVAIFVAPFTVVFSMILLYRNGEKDEDIL